MIYRELCIRLTQLHPPARPPSFSISLKSSYPGLKLISPKSSKITFIQRFSELAFNYRWLSDYHGPKIYFRSLLHSKL